MAAPATGSCVRRFGIASGALGGASIGVGISRTVLALSGTRRWSVSAIVARCTAGRNGRIGHSADFDRFNQ